MLCFYCTNYYKSYRNTVEFRLFKSETNQDILGMFRRGKGKARMTEKFNHPCFAKKKCLYNRVQWFIRWIKNQRQKIKDDGQQPIDNNQNWQLTEILFNQLIVDSIVS